MKYRYFLLSLMGVAFTACDETTGTLGIPADHDQISNSVANFPVYTKSVLATSGIQANTTYSYLGHVVDPETGCAIDADFVAQFQTFENYDFPDKKLMVNAQDSNNIKYGVPTCDSCDVRLYFSSYYGDANNPMKLQVFALSTDADKQLKEDSLYNTDLDLSQFLSDDAKPLASRMFTVTDFNVSEEDRESSSYQPNIYIKLPASFGQHILDKYYEDASNFKDSYAFTHNVLPGLYFRCSDGNGTMVRMHANTLNLFFKYKDAEVDTIYNAMTRFAATPEVVQSTRFQNSEKMADLVNINDYTYLKTPAGIFTEIEIPMKDIFEGEHAADSLSKASISFTRYNKTEQNNYQLGIPSEVLLIRKDEMEDYFRNHKTELGIVSYISTFSSAYNTYTFSNISRILSYCQHEKVNDIVARLANKGYAQYTEAQYEAEEALWETENPDWNKFLLVPITSTSTTSENTYGSSTTVTSINHCMDLNSIRLVGGTTPIQLNVVYSRFK